MRKVLEQSKIATPIAKTKEYIITRNYRYFQLLRENKEFRSVLELFKNAAHAVVPRYSDLQPAVLEYVMAKIMNSQNALQYAQVVKKLSRPLYDVFTQKEQLDLLQKDAVRTFFIEKEIVKDDLENIAQLVSHEDPPARSEAPTERDYAIACNYFKVRKVIAAYLQEIGALYLEYGLFSAGNDDVSGLAAYLKEKITQQLLGMSQGAESKEINLGDFFEEQDQEMVQVEFNPQVLSSVFVTPPVIDLYHAVFVEHMDRIMMSIAKSFVRGSVDQKANIVELWKSILEVYATNVFSLEEQERVILKLWENSVLMSLVLDKEIFTNIFTYQQIVVFVERAIEKKDAFVLQVLESCLSEEWICAYAADEKHAVDVLSYFVTDATVLKEVLCTPSVQEGFIVDALAHITVDEDFAERLLRVHKNKPGIVAQIIMVVEPVSAQVRLLRNMHKVKDKGLCAIAEKLCAADPGLYIELQEYISPQKIYDEVLLGRKALDRNILKVLRQSMPPQKMYDLYVAQGATALVILWEQESDALVSKYLQAYYAQADALAEYWERLLFQSKEAKRRFQAFKALDKMKKLTTEEKRIWLLEEDSAFLNFYLDQYAVVEYVDYIDDLLLMNPSISFAVQKRLRENSQHTVDDLCQLFLKSETPEESLYFAQELLSRSVAENKDTMVMFIMEQKILRQRDLQLFLQGNGYVGEELGAYLDLEKEVAAQPSTIASQQRQRWSLLPAEIQPEEMQRIVLRLGFTTIKSASGHIKIEKRDMQGKQTAVSLISGHSKVTRGLMKLVIKQTGITVEEFLAAMR